MSWNKRIGTIVPVSNTTNEIEFNRLKPNGVTVQFTRDPLDTNPGDDDFKAMLMLMSSPMAVLLVQWPALLTV